MKLFVVLAAVALLLGAAGAASTGTRADSSRLAQASLDFINHEQAAGAADHKAQQAPLRPSFTTEAGRLLPAPTTVPRPQTTPRPQPAPRPRPTSRYDDSQQHQQHQLPQQPQQPKRDWELVPPHQGPTPTRSPPPRVTPPPHHDWRQDLMTTTPRSRVYNIPISVEGRDNATVATTTEQSRWYDKFFGKGTDTDDDSPWGRRRRQAPPQDGLPGPRGAERSEVVIGSNAIRVGAARRPQPQPRPSQ